MDETEFQHLDGVALAGLLRRKEIKVKEVLETSISLLEKVNGQLNAVAHTRLDALFAEAEQVDVGQGGGRFDGVPIFLKDLSQVIAGEGNVAGSRLFKEWKVPQTANIVEGFLAAGCLAVGYSTTPEFGLKNITEAKVYGATRNPWNPAFSPGGSSGGSAALVASGVVPIAGASDGGGSIRIPASFTGLFGLKPTRGRTLVGPGVGRQWQGASIDFVLTRSVRDSARMLDHLQTVQEEAAFQTPLYAGSYEKAGELAARKLRIGFSLDSPVGTPVSADAKAAVMKLVHWLEAKGHVVEEADNGVDGVQLMRDYYLMNSGEISAMTAGLEAALGRAMKADDMEMEAWMMHVAGKNVTAAAFSASLASWDVAAAKMVAYHQTYDFYVTPATASEAPKVGELTPSAEKEAAYKAEIEQLDATAQQELIYDMFLPSLTYTPFTQLANLTGQPAMSVPLHVTEEGLPIGVQVMARKGAEHELLQLAFGLEKGGIWQGMKGNPYFEKNQKVRD